MTADSKTQSSATPSPAPAAQPKPEPAAKPPADEVGGPEGAEPTRFGDWEKSGRCSDF